jgi:hypothetical protein
VAQQEEAIEAEGARVIWVLEQDSSNMPGTAVGCRDFMDGQGSDGGLCVGDAETQPVPGTFDNSPFSSFRGFDIIVHRETMQIVFNADHGTPGGNDNLNGEAILQAVIDNAP